MKKVFATIFLSVFVSAMGAELKNHLPFGVTWSWEHNAFYARARGEQEWTFVENLLKTLTSLNFDTLWVLNIGLEDTVKLCELAEKYQVKVLPTVSPLYHLHNYGLMEELEKTTEMVVGKLGNRKSLLGYVLVDEPRNYMVQEMEYFRKALKEKDPGKEAIVCTMIHDTETYIKKSKFPVACTDCYPFGGELSPYIPNPSPASQNCYRMVVGSLADQANNAGKSFWVVAQAFAEIWGPYWYDENKNAVIEPGSYHHWRMPTTAEEKWLIWESLRAGCKGILFFNLFPAVPLWDGKGELPEKWKDWSQKAKEQKLPQLRQQLKTNTGTALLCIDGSPGPQMKEIGNTFGVIKKHKELILSLRKSDFPFVFTEDKFKVESFVKEKEKNAGYVIVVNDDVSQKRTEKIYFLPHVQEIEDLTGERRMEVKHAAAGELRQIQMELPPGEGSILKVKFAKDNAGFLLLNEDFTLSSLAVKTENVIIQPVKRGWSTGWDWVAERQKDAGPHGKGVLSLPQMAELRGFLRGILNSKSFDVFFFLRGDFKGPESVIVEITDEQGKKNWLLSNNYHLPAIIPRETKGLSIMIGEGVKVRNIMFFAIPVSY